MQQWAYGGRLYQNHGNSSENTVREFSGHPNSRNSFLKIFTFATSCTWTALLDTSD